MTLPWAQWEASDEEISAIAEKFILANSYNPQAAILMFSRCQVSKRQDSDYCVESAPFTIFYNSP